jgi:eukaryotic-like serine/threonine-protein kinase
VLEQSPAAGTRLALGGGVKITVSNGKGKGVAVPHVVGMKQDAAVKALEDAGLVAKVKLVDVGTKQEQGVVIAQDPVASTQVDRGSTVVVQVGRSPAQATTAPAPGP